jgi:phosphinothricin acetyltransferase
MARSRAAASSTAASHIPEPDPTHADVDIVDLVSELVIRPAAAGDAAAVAAIYNEGIADRLATFETRPRSAGEVAAWLESALPFLVAADGDEVLGWARVSAYSDRCVYEGVGEHAVYVARAARGRGAGRLLLDALCREAERAGLYKLTSRVFTDNGPSLAVHAAAGFDEVGIQRRHGRLDGRWKDCVLVERLLGEAAA